MNTFCKYDLSIHYVDTLPKAFEASSAKPWIGIVLLVVEGTGNDSGRLLGEYSVTLFSSFQALLKRTCGTTGYTKMHIYTSLYIQNS